MTPLQARIHAAVTRAAEHLTSTAPESDRELAASGVIRDALIPSEPVIERRLA